MAIQNDGGPRRRRFDQTQGGVLFNGPEAAPVPRDNYTVTRQGRPGKATLGGRPVINPAGGAWWSNIPQSDLARRDALIRRASGAASTKTSSKFRKVG